MRSVTAEEEGAQSGRRHQSLSTGSIRLPRRVRVEGSPNHRRDFPHTTLRESSRQSLKQPRLVHHGDEVPFQVRDRG